MNVFTIPAIFARALGLGDGVKTLSLGIPGGKQVIIIFTSTSNRGLICVFFLQGPFSFEKKRDCDWALQSQGLADRQSPTPPPPLLSDGLDPPMHSPFNITHE